MGARWILFLVIGFTMIPGLVSCQSLSSSTPDGGQPPVQSTQLPQPEQTQPAPNQAGRTPTLGFSLATDQPTQDSQESTVEKIVVLPTPDDPQLQKMVEQVKADLAGRLSIPVEQVALIELKSVSWPDGSLGCPQPGMAYTQVMVDGLLIRLHAAANFYEYHSGGQRALFLCENPQ